uniref:Uncharacterized protein n=1 Tax=Eucampia antarctica TaxID=49252 RepID=A0A7S2RL76_9STRA|mmetsp:Transcript_23689/g.22718  ORF Transcript_23689/g.22718 Transcript_23689/m.22718 type:complete len:308 (+) Transcript_23689:187-1110(+)
MLLIKKYGNITLLSVLTATSFIPPSASFPFQKSSLSKKYNGNSIAEDKLHPLSLLQAIPTIEETEAPPKVGNTNVCFHTERILESEPYPSLSSTSMLNDFLGDNKMNVLRGTNNEVEEASDDIQQNYYSTWVEKSKSAGYAEPTGNDIIYRIINSGTKFPGLKVTSHMYMGCKLITSSESKSEYPELQFTLLNSKNVAEGSKVMVWIYNKLTGEGKEEKDEEKGQNSSDALMRFSITPNDNGTLVFHSSSMLNIDIEFPSVLIKIMPVSKERVEKLGSDVIATALDTEGRFTLKSMEEAYISLIGGK